jgi:hypothetical protein
MKTKISCHCPFTQPNFNTLKRKTAKLREQFSFLCAIFQRYKTSQQCNIFGLHHKIVCYTVGYRGRVGLSKIMTKTTYNVYFPVSRKNSNLRFRERHYCISLFFYLWKLFYVQKYKPSQNLMVVSGIVYLTCGSLYNFLAKCFLPKS